MRGRTVRLQSITLKNFKNVKNGKIEMPNAYKRILSCNNAEVLGIYGQNGSGKTAVIDAVYFLQQIMVGENLERELLDYIGKKEKQAEIIAEFAIFNLNEIFEVGYRVVLERISDNEVEIVRECLNCAVNTKDGERSNKTVFMDYSRDDEENVFLPKKRVDELVGNNAENKIDLLVAKKIAEKSKCSYIFGESSREIFAKQKGKPFEHYADIIGSLIEFSTIDLFVIRSAHSGVISASFVLPMAFRIEEQSDEGIGFKGEFAMPLHHPDVLDDERKMILEEIIDKINIVLPTIIPGMRIDIKNYGKQLDDEGVEGTKLELLSVRGDVVLPIRMESEGIVKIISILSALIQAFGNKSICLLIDELDAGVFEYMLGELLDIFKKSAKGQLIFTSHNLRPLEMLDKESVMFSTTNPENRYIHMKNIRPTNNFRDVYLRSITLGGQDEEIYEETESLKIARAFRKANRSKQNGEGRKESNFSNS